MWHCWHHHGHCLTHGHVPRPWHWRRWQGSLRSLSLFALAWALSMPRCCCCGTVQYVWCHGMLGLSSVQQLMWPKRAMTFAMKVPQTTSSSSLSPECSPLRRQSRVADRALRQPCWRSSQNPQRRQWRSKGCGAPNPCKPELGEIHQEIVSNPQRNNPGRDQFRLDRSERTNRQKGEQQSRINKSTTDCKPDRVDGSKVGLSACPGPTTKGEQESRPRMLLWQRADPLR